MLYSPQSQRPSLQRCHGRAQIISKTETIAVNRENAQAEFVGCSHHADALARFASGSSARCFDGCEVRA
jgi:hypothetical protein